VQTKRNIKTGSQTENGSLEERVERVIRQEPSKMPFALRDGASDFHS